MGRVIRCSGMLFTGLHSSRRCQARVPEGRAEVNGWRVSRFGAYCPKHFAPDYSGRAA